MANDDNDLWYKDAIVYQLHVRCFFDSNNDGVGDFRGLVDKLDYIRDLGVNAIWLLPFYPSPLRDDGYDIADYTDVHPAYGTLRDFQLFLDEAHKRQIRVITELVINHTSDQHPWFQAARQAPPDSAERAFYVWSDDDKKFPETRIIFTDSETSNWAWDPVAQAYYWHRFFSHQPDLNHNNPQVVEAVTRLMRFWLDAGVDGLRLDAIPYLCVREGSDNENLPETHQVIKRMRAELDRHYSGRLFLAEANQWPEDACEYFGDGDECHMAFHFPLMPRIYMAVAQQDRHPITDIMRQTPDIPASCQWAIFLRNHDELTLEMVTDRERDYMYTIFATDPRMRVNIGIRRRLAPLMDNDRARIELLNSLLMSMPGTPIVYYGDELGMGDNIYLGDRNGVRTPMQWSGDRNAGFSRADPAQLYLPVIMDPVYGYQAVSVEAQSRSSSSLLNWMRRLIAVRRGHRAFGRGSIEFLYPANRKILAYLREDHDETILCVANLAPSAQPVELDMRRYNGRVPVEMMGRTPFPRIGELPYFLTLPGHGFYWFRLASAEEAASWQSSDEVGPTPALPCLVLGQGSGIVLSDKECGRLEREALPTFLASRRWFAAKGTAIEQVQIVHQARWGADDRWLLNLLRVELEGRAAQSYFVPLAVAWDDEPGQDKIERFVICRVRRGRRTGLLYDALGDEHFIRSLVGAVAGNERSALGPGHLVCTTTATGARLGAEPPEVVRYPPFEQSNSSVVVDERWILKVFRYVQPGLNPEAEMGRFLGEVAGYPHAPRLLGTVEYHEGEATLYVIGVLQSYTGNRGDGWALTLEHLDRYLRASLQTDAAPEAAELLERHLAWMRLLGLRTGQLHQALAPQTGDADFDPEPVSGEELQGWIGQVAEAIPLTLDRLAAARQGLSHGVGLAADAVLAARERLVGFVERWRELLHGAFAGQEDALFKTRNHGDFHLGQVLMVGNDAQLVDFEGEVSRPLNIRREKHSPLRDVAGMLRSIDYAAQSTLRALLAEHREREAELWALAANWENAVADAFVEGYHEGVEGCPTVPEDPAVVQTMIDLFVLQKALYELRYELDHRPDWLGIPLAGLASAIEGWSRDQQDDRAAAEERQQ